MQAVSLLATAHVLHELHGQSWHSASSHVLSLLLDRAGHAHLRTHVVKGANSGCGSLQSNIQCQPKITQLELTILSQEQILYLDVPAANAAMLNIAPVAVYAVCKQY